MTVNLNSLYRRYNKRYFGSRLPQKMLIVMFEGKQCRPRDLGLYVPEGGRVYAGKERFNGPLIMLRTDMFECQVKLTLFHEMCHVDGACDHGPRWQGKMRRLAQSGAFDKLW